MKNLLAKFRADVSGASAAEYALILAVFGGFVVLGMNMLGSGFKASMGAAKTTLSATHGTEGA